MLGFIIVFAIFIPLMVWALSPRTTRKRKSPRGCVASADTTSLPRLAGTVASDLGSSCDAGSGSCDGGGS
jgi:hypothetical protein